MVKGLILVIDGLGDRPNAKLSNQTPLQAAHTPNFDRLATEGCCGQIDPFIPGMPVGTHTGTALLLGAGPSQVFGLGRGPIEACGCDVSVGRDDVVLRGNLATVERGRNGFVIVDRRAGRIREGTEALAAALSGMTVADGVRVEVQPATQHRVAVVLSGPGALSDCISDTDPGSLHRGKQLLNCFPTDERSQAAALTARAVNQFVERAFDVLGNHPVNKKRLRDGQLPATGVITRGAGKLNQLRSIIHQLHLGVTVISAERTVLGLAKLMGFNAVTAPGFTALPDTDLNAKIAAAVAALEHDDLVYVHIKGTDTLGHDKDPAGKRDLITRIDQAISPLMNTDLVVGVSADHSTDSASGRHTGDPVPSLLRVPGGRQDLCTRFSEFDCMQGGLGRITAQAFALGFLDGVGALGNYRPSDSDYLV